MKKKSWVTGIIIGFVVIVAGSLLYTNHQKQVDIAEHSAPYYADANKKVVLLSASQDKLNDYQEEQFYSIARGTIDGEVRDGISDKMDDKSLYVEKVKGKGRYYIEYVSRWDTGFFKQNFTTSFVAKLETADFRKSDTFTTYQFQSDLTDFVNENDPD
ncbi:hypothetical protein [Lapidilactobacillus bayanensis]|uniref:hypothetical protein n=1 Tax=Lapidilactobacillus bayanensis TaxID=2485998 RepID=UPI000F7B3CC2|nr:hypothetical protein [Lapidilactobacillus bayanensis]